MGMYTGLRIKVTVKEEFRQMVEDINEGADWSDYAEEFPFLASYSKQSRAEFIPHGALCYMPGSWETGDFPNTQATDGFNHNFDIKTGYWSFQCSLKNHNDEVKQFFEEVLSNMIESAEHIECLYEEWDESILYSYVNGEIVEAK